MAFAKLFNLFAVSVLAVLICNLGVSPVNAIAHDGHHMLKVKRAHGHDGVMRRKRSTGQRCKTRATSSVASPPAPTVEAISIGSSSSSPSPSPSSSSSSSPSAPASTSSPIGGTSGKKVGLAWPNGNADSLKNFVTERTKYIYTWSEQCPDSAKSLGLDCMPMIWGYKNADAFQSTVKAGYANIAMGFNEVNEGGQANLDVDTAISLWWQYLEPLHNQGYQLLAPVTSSNPNGNVWMHEFMGKCQGCHIAGMPVHYYGTSADDMKSYIEKWAGDFGLPIWVTEFACQNYNTANENNGQQCSESQVWEFYKSIIQYMESSNDVVAYFPFGVMLDMQGVNSLDQLMQSDGSPTALGSSVINVSFN